MASDDAPVPVSREFEADVRALAEVRSFVCHVARIRLDHPAILVASELAANAIRHAGSPFTVGVTASSAVRIEVSDRSPTPPAVSPIDAHPGGLGLRVVEALSLGWGVDQIESGKRVWAEIPAADIG